MTKQKNEEILNELEGNKKFRVIELFDTIIHAKDKYEAIKKLKLMKKNLVECNIMEERSNSFKKNFEIAVGLINRK